MVSTWTNQSNQNTIQARSLIDPPPLLPTQLNEAMERFTYHSLSLNLPVEAARILRLSYIAFIVCSLLLHLWYDFHAHALLTSPGVALYNCEFQSRKWIIELILWKFEIFSVRHLFYCYYVFVVIKKGHDLSSVIHLIFQRALTRMHEYKKHGIRSQLIGNIMKWKQK